MIISLSPSIGGEPYTLLTALTKVIFCKCSTSCYEKVAMIWEMLNNVDEGLLEWC
jgi:hypothetical protein